MSQVIYVNALAIRPVDLPADLAHVVEWLRSESRRSRRGRDDSRPLLRGALTPADWFTFNDWPDWEYRAATPSVWCPMCGRFHFHGWQTWDLGTSHRLAHCVDDRCHQL